ncbi:MAG: SipW-dependent-type signal peptide-containing protein [Oscillospiraceae bacterium]|nr:SipW-dependent-type signal peptide-containing protein [Oscillospiraceae bacterium]
MNSKKVTRSAVFASFTALLLCASMLVATTFAWFTDSVTSSGNIIKSGTLDVEMSWADGTKAVPADDSTDWTDASTGAIFNYDLWEPGYTEVRHIKIKNAGTLALKYQLRIVATGTASDLTDAIDVYFTDPAAQVADRTALNAVTPIGSLTSVLAAMPANTKGELTDGSSAVVTLALKMRESAGNEYQNKSIGSSFAVQLLATQLTAENDSFDNQYDVEAPLDYILVSNATELKAALAAKEANIMLTDDAVASEPYTVDYNANINGAGHTIKRADGYTGTLFNVATGATLTMEAVVVDGGAVWANRSVGSVGNSANNGVVATGNLIATTGNGSIVLNKDAVLQNNDGVNAVSLATRGGGTLTVNGAQIINNRSAAGAIWGGGNIIINEGSKINGNHATSIGGAIRMVDGYNNITFTMNGGEMNYNSSAGTGGAIWGGNRATYIFNGGEMAYNTSATGGGAIWTGTYESYTFAGSFELHDNSSGDLGGAVRFRDHASLTMTGGAVYGNTVNGESSAFYLNNNSATITGGSIADNFSYSGGLGLTMGNVDMDGVISFDLATNHNTAYLAESFSGFKFTVNEAAANFAQFNFKPAAGYTYTAGDEAKLVCMNAGYATYWDAATGTFRLQAI